MNAALIVSAAMAVIVALTSGCAVAPTADRYYYSHTIDGTGACSVLRATDEGYGQVRFLCGDSHLLADSCRGGQPIHVHAEKGAGEGQPFGVGSLVELDSSGCEQ